MLQEQNTGETHKNCLYILNLKDFILTINIENKDNFAHKQYLKKKMAESRILLIEHKYPPPPYFSFFSSSCFYAYFRLG